MLVVVLCLYLKLIAISAYYLHHTRIIYSYTSAKVVATYIFRLIRGNSFNFRNISHLSFSFISRLFKSAYIIYVYLNGLLETLIDNTIQHRLNLLYTGYIALDNKL